MVSPKKIFARSFVIAILLFVAGILLGLGIDFARTSDMVNDFRQSELDSESYLIEQNFLAFFGGDKCAQAEQRLNQLSKELGKIGTYLIKYESKNIVKQKDYDYYLRKYFLSEIKTYTYYSQIKTECDIGEDIILFFFKVDEPDSVNQGDILDVIVSQNKDVSVFSINVDYKDDPVIESVKSKYNIKTTPTLIINNDIKKESLTNKQEILDIIN